MSFQPVVINGHNLETRMIDGRLDDTMEEASPTYLDQAP